MRRPFLDSRPEHAIEIRIREDAIRVEPIANGEIITELPTSRQVVSDAARPAFSQSSWARPVIVRSGSSTEPLPTLTCCERKERRSSRDRSASLPKRSRR